MCIIFNWYTFILLNFVAQTSPWRTLSISFICSPVGLAYNKGSANLTERMSTAGGRGRAWASRGQGGKAERH